MPDVREEILLICCQVGDPAEQRLARLDALLADPVRRLAILSLVGDVREGWLYTPHADAPNKWAAWPREGDEKPDADWTSPPCFVVVPVAGEATP